MTIRAANVTKAMIDDPNIITYQVVVHNIRNGDPVFAGHCSVQYMEAVIQTMDLTKPLTLELFNYSTGRNDFLVINPANILGIEFRPTKDPNYDDDDD